MTKVLMAINPKFVDEILSKRKKYEYRKIRPKRKDINKMIIYATAPVMKVVAEVEVMEILEDKPDVIWNMTKDESGISKSFYDKYYKKKNIAVAYKLGKIKIYDKPKNLREIGIDFIPQSFVYLD